MKITQEFFGRVGKKTATLYTISNNNRMKMKVTDYGGIVTSLTVPDKNGRVEDVVLGYDSLWGYLEKTPYFGCIVGRCANRIAGGEFKLNGKTYTLAKNNGPNHLHGGIKGFDKVIWESTEFKEDDRAGVVFTYLSRNGEEGYPGNLKVEVSYTLTQNNEFEIRYKAETDAPTPLNLTHHSYFNLNGANEYNILEHVLTIDAEKYTAVDETLIPTGELKNVEDSPLDFRTPQVVGDRIDEVEGGYDHNYVLNKAGEYRRVAELYDPESGRAMEVFTSEPGIQFYSGNFLDGSIRGKRGRVYYKHYGLCLETQHFPDSPNQPGFPNSILRPGEEFQSQTTYRFFVR